MYFSKNFGTCAAFLTPFFFLPAFISFCSVFRVHSSRPTFSVVAVMDVSPMLTKNAVMRILCQEYECDSAPYILQVIGVNYIHATPNTHGASCHRVECKLSDGTHYFTGVLAKQLSSLYIVDRLECGASVLLSKYVRQPLSDGKSTVICLDLSIVGSPISVISNPEEYIVPHPPTAPSHNFVSVECDGHCPSCGEDPCDWVVVGPHIVKSIFQRNGDAEISGPLTKASRFSAYGMFTRAKYGELGKGNRKKLPDCVTNGLRDNFPDPNKKYVGFMRGDRAD